MALIGLLILFGIVCAVVAFVAARSEAKHSAGNGWYMEDNNNSTNPGGFRHV